MFRVSNCFSEVTLRIWEKADRFAPQRGSWKAWLTAVTRNTAYNFARQTARRGEGELPEHAPSPAPDPEEALLWAEWRRALQRVLFYRKYYYLQPTSQIASELGTTERAVEGRLYRLKKRLRGMLGGELDG